MKKRGFRITYLGHKIRITRQVEQDRAKQRQHLRNKILKLSSRDFLEVSKSFYFILYSENQCISKHDKIDIFIDMKFH